MSCRLPAAAALALLALGLVLPGLGRFGLWEPWEVQIAESAAGLVGLGGGPGSAGGIPSPQVVLAALGLRLFGPGEAGARLPGALLALATLLALVWAASSRGHRAGLTAGLVLASTPLFLLQARQLTSDMGLLLGSAVALGALGRLADPAPDARPWLPAALAAAGLGLAGATGGLLVGVVPPCLAFGAAWLLGGGYPRARSFRILGISVALAGVTLALAALLAPYRAGQFSGLLGGAPLFGPSGRTFESAFRVLGFGLFPWSALALFAVLVPLTELEVDPPAAGRPGRAGLLLPVFCVVFGVACATLQQHLVGQARLPVLPAVALLLGWWLAGPPGVPNRVLGLVVAAGTALVARDLWHAPEELLSVHLPAKITWPPGFSLGPLFALTGALAAAAALARLVLPEPAGPERSSRLASRAHRLAAPVLLASAILFSAGLALGVVPALSRHLSHKRQYETFRAMAGPGTALAYYRVPRSGGGPFALPAGSPVREVASAGELAARFRADPGLFALVPRPELASIDDAFRQVATPYAVVDASSTRVLLLAGRLPEGGTDKNPLDAVRFLAAIARHPPWPPASRPASARFGDAIELQGADFPPTVRRPGSFPLVLHFRALSRPPAGYQIFVHLEQRGTRLHGDHAPLGGLLPTERWRIGDHLRDEHRVVVPLVTAPAGVYTVYVGFWPGGRSPRRLPVTAGTAGTTNDGRDRVALGTIRVE